jgi:hypothetical protein
MPHENVRSRQFNPRAGAIVQHQLDLVRARGLFDQNVQLLEQPQTRVVVVTAWHDYAQNPALGNRLFLWALIQPRGTSE